MSVLLTGAAGFIGFHVARRLLERGQRVVVIDNLNAYHDVRLKEARVARLSRYPGFDFAKRSGVVTDECSYRPGARSIATAPRDGEIKRMLRALIGAVALEIVFALVHASAVAAGCLGAAVATTHANCGRSDLAAAEAQLSAASSRLRASLPADRRAALDLDQEDWLQARKASCGDKRGEAFVHCLLDETAARSRALAGEGQNGLAGGPPLRPVFFHQKDGAYEIAVIYPQIENKTPAARAFNAAAHDLILGDRSLMAEFRKAKAGAVFSSVFYDVVYSDPRLVTIVFWIVSSERWGQPFTGRESLVFDLSRARPLRLDDIVKAPAAMVMPIANLCRKQLAEEAAWAGWPVAPQADPAMVIADFHNWAPGWSALDIFFDPGLFPADAAGPRECRLNYRDLAAWLKPGGPLPPR